MPSLAIFVYDLSATGVVRNALAVATHMQASGWRVTLVTCRPGGELSAQGEGIARLNLHDAPSPRSRSLDLAMSVLRLRRTIGELAPDVLLSAGNHAHFPCWLAMRGRARPVRVYRISNDPGHGRGGGLARYSPRRLSMRLLVSDARRLIVVSPALAADPALAGHAAANKTVVIQNGVDVEKVRRLAADPDFVAPWASGGDPVVLAVGRLVAQKNLATLVEAMAIANRQRSLRLVILGHGTPAARAELMDRARACGLENKLALPGTCANPFAAMRRAELVAVPSLWEGSPNVLLEAMACGTPVVASRTAGNAAQILDHDRFGVLVDPLDPQEMAAAILRQCDSARWVLPGERAASYDGSVALDKYHEVMQGLVTGS